MKLKYFCTALLLTVLPYLFGCGSGSYEIEKGDYKDSTYYKRTGAKLKNFYKIQNPPPFTLQISGTFNLGLAELSSNYQNNFDSIQFSQGKNFGVKTGYGVSATGKIPLHKKGNVRLNISGAFNRFQSDFLTNESPFGNVSYNVFGFGAGIENSFNPSLRLKPYLGAEIHANLISGKANIRSSTTNTTRNVTFKNSFRIGYVICSGFEFMFNNRVGMNFGVRLSNANQLLKQTKTSSDPNVVPLRDKKDDTASIEFGGFKNFIYASFNLGFNFYFGVKNIIYQFNK